MVGKVAHFEILKQGAAAPRSSLFEVYLNCSDLHSCIVPLATVARARCMKTDGVPESMGQFSNYDILIN